VKSKMIDLLEILVGGGYILLDKDGHAVLQTETPSKIIYCTVEFEGLKQAGYIYNSIQNQWLINPRGRDEWLRQKMLPPVPHQAYGVDGQIIKRTNRVPRTPLSVFLEDELLERGWTLAELSHRMGLDPIIIDGLFTGAYLIHPDLAQRLSNAFGTSAEFWLRLFTYEVYDEN
jgi:plasmid maintenance system antidote protein VapI